MNLMLLFQEMLLDELVQGAADRTVDGGRNLLSYADVGAEPLRRKSTRLSDFLLNAECLHVMVTWQLCDLQPRPSISCRSTAS
jgi:hypothetical protein